MLDDITCDRLLQRIGLTDRPASDASGLRVVHRAFVSHVPYEDLAVQLGECEPLDPLALIKRVLRGGRGGYCFELNTVLQTLLEALGFAVERRQGIVGARDAHAAGEPTNHLALVVHTPDAGPFIAESGWGEGPLDPLPLIEGPVRAGAFTFVQTLVVQQPFDDRIITLRACTVFSDGPGRRHRRVLENPQAFAAVLRDAFGIDPEALGPERLHRLWAKAADQHDAHRVATESNSSPSA
jgi:N-hydroxyarylamine O-acetyltransferase